METNTKYFGKLPYTQNEVITFADGIFGFAENKNYLLIRFEENNAGILCLQNLEEPNLAFIVANPFFFAPKYQPMPAQGDLEKLGSPAMEQLLFYNICTLDEDISKSTINLRCPLMIHGETHQAVQIILEDTRYGFKQPFHELAKENALC